MTLTFLGTRGNIDVRSRRHRRHTSTLVSQHGVNVMIDCGADWLRMVRGVAPHAIVLTHAHPDHIDGLKNGAPCPVYAPAAVWPIVQRWRIREFRRLSPRAPTDIGGIRFEMVSVDHSVIAPAVGYRITAGAAIVFYAPDVLRIRRTMSALADLTVYVGDGATIERPITRLQRQTGIPVGHAPITTQLEWCMRAGVRRAIFTHCGRAIVAGPSELERQIAAIGRSYGIAVRVAYDGLRLTLR